MDVDSLVEFVAVDEIEYGEDAGASSSAFQPEGGSPMENSSGMEEEDAPEEMGVHVRFEQPAIAEMEMEMEDAWDLECFHQQCAADPRDVAGGAVAGLGEGEVASSAFARLFRLDRQPIYRKMTLFSHLLRLLEGDNAPKVDVAATLAQVLIPAHDPGDLGLPLLVPLGGRPRRNFAVLPWSFRLGQPEGEANITLWVQEVLEMVGDHGGKIVFAGDEKTFSALVKFKQLHGWDRVVPFIGDFHVLMKMQSVILELLAEGEAFVVVFPVFPWVLCSTFSLLSYFPVLSSRRSRRNGAQPGVPWAQGGATAESPARESQGLQDLG